MDLFVGASLDWLNLQGIHPQAYTCWRCGREIATDRGYAARDVSRSRVEGWIAICPYCQFPTIRDHSGSQAPAPPYGPIVQDIPDEHVVQLYNEARQTVAAEAPTAAVLACRKLLMHIAVSKGAREGDSFVRYVDYLVENHYVPPDAQDWVDDIRTTGNWANHEVVIATDGQAKELIDFCGMLLKVIFEFPAASRRKATNVGKT